MEKDTLEIFCLRFHYPRGTCQEYVFITMIGMLDSGPDRAGLQKLSDREVGASV